MTSPLAGCSAIGEGRAFTTVGISHLTTSRRLGAQPVKAVEVAPGSYRLDGTIPWVTAAERADVLVTGAVLDDGRQMLIALPADRPGVEVRPPFPLAALQASCTTEVVLKDVRVDDSDLLAGPATDIMSNPGAVGTAGLETSALALGQARAALAALVDLSPDRTDLAEPLEVLCENWRTYWGQLIAQARGEPDAVSPGQIRTQANSLVLRSTQAYLDGATRDRFSSDRARPAMGAPGPLLPGLVVPDAGRPGRHPRPGGVVPGLRDRRRGISNTTSGRRSELYRQTCRVDGKRLAGRRPSPHLRRARAQGTRA